MFEDDYYLESQLGALKQSIVLFMQKYKNESEGTK